ncbi:MAG: hypothetical protein GTO29_03755 [Candidatus Latescibacteria bacterium]|nr:hypothetical protein [Candidatus Latescibacterota bacterium]NIO55191.1 hypothetical protein [Candidatus Latescibacterota bacterium]
MKKSDSTVNNPGDLSQPFRLGVWDVHPNLNRISEGDVTIHLEPKAMDVLVCLASRPGHMFSRRELLDTVWGDVVVGEEVLSRVISVLRSALGDSSKHPRYVETIHGRGYRLIASVSAASEDVTSGVSTDKGRPRRASWVSWTVVSVALVALVWLGFELSSRNVLLRRGDPPPYAVVPFTSYAGCEEMPAISPDGTMVAFSWDGLTGDNVDIYVKQANVESPLRLTTQEGADRYPTWSPDGTEVAYVGTSANGRQIFVVPAIGGVPRRLIDSRNVVRGISWSPDGQYIAYSGRSEPDLSTQIVTCNIETGANRELTPTAPLGRDDVDPVYSPDGKSIAFVRKLATGMEDIYIVSVEGGAPRRITDSFQSVDGFDWQPEGQFLICSAFTGSSQALWRVSVANGEVTWVPGIGDWAFSPSIARQTGRMVYQHHRKDKNIWRVKRSTDPDGTPETRAVIMSSYVDTYPRLSPNGGAIAFTSTRSGSFQVWICDADGHHAVQLTSFADCYVALPSWSPSGDRIAFSANPEGIMEMFLVDVEGGYPARLTHGESSVLATGWSGDGEWVYFLSDRSGDWELWKLKAQVPDWDAAIQLTVGGAVYGVESSDGRHLYYTKTDQSGIWRRPLTGFQHPSDAVRVLEDVPQVGEWYSWTLCGGGIVLVSGTEGKRQLLYHDFASGVHDTVAQMDHLAVSSVSASADCSTILYVRDDSVVGDLMLVDGFE